MKLNYFITEQTNANPTIKRVREENSLNVLEDLELLSYNAGDRPSKAVLCCNSIPIVDGGEVDIASSVGRVLRT
jgi:hypothetical protein